MFDRLDTTQYADLSVSDFAYDKNSNLTQHITPSTAVIDYVYDALNRLTDKDFPANTTLNTDYVYDLGSRLTDADNTASTIDLVYDALNRVTSDTQTLNSNIFQTTFQYDKTGNRTKTTYPSGKIVDLTYDANQRLTQTIVNTGSLAIYDYDPLNRRITRTLATSNQQQATYTYDLANQLLEINNQVNGTGTLSAYVYDSYDDVGNRLKSIRTLQANPSETRNYTYNDIYELTGVTGTQTNSYAYDKVGNRTTADSITYVDNNLNQYTSVNSTTYTYDGNANLTTDGNNTYTYDAENRMATASNTSNTASYTYDAFNRRVSKTVNSTDTYFIYDGDSVIEEADSSGTNLATYVNGPNIDEVLSMDRSSNTYYYHYDGLGSVTELTNSSGALQENYNYDAYGNITGSSTVGNPYFFTGRRLDPETNIYHYRARQYDPTIGRFLQRDPLGYWDSTNLYSYVVNNPTNFLDPSGEGRIGVIIKIGKKAWNHIKKRHINRGIFQHKSKFKDPSQIGKNIKKTVNNPDRVVKQANGNKLLEKNMRKKVGTKGETIQSVVVSKTGEVVTSFPAKSFTIPGANLGIVVFGDNMFGEAINFFNPLSDLQDVADVFQDQEFCEAQ